MGRGVKEFRLRGIFICFCYSFEPIYYYMRKDDMDLFADRNEGKVLVMDNLFAQTNAYHLLKPLMDMAKKANTQLICLTGLGGELIYNRFDNIHGVIAD